jgi:hypothetical protein
MYKDEERAGEMIEKSLTSCGINLSKYLKITNLARHKHTVYLHSKEKLVNAVEGDNRCLHREFHETVKMRSFVLEQVAL